MVQVRKSLTSRQDTKIRIFVQIISFHKEDQSETIPGWWQLEGRGKLKQFINYLNSQNNLLNQFKS